MSKAIEAGRQRRQRADYRRRHKVSEAAGNAIKISLRKGIETFRDSISLDHLMALLRSGTPREVYAQLPWKRLEGLLEPATKKLLKAGDIAASSAYTDLPKSNTLRYDTRNPEFVRYLEQRAGTLITRVQDGTLDAVRTNVRRSFDKGLTPRQIAQDIRGSIGLNGRQAVALQNFRTGLLEQGHSPERLEALSGAYESRLLDQRAQTIAQHEVRAAQNAGEQSVWQAAQSQDLLPADAKRVWVVDGNPCPKLCRPMSGVKVALSEPWKLPDGRLVDLVTDAHTHCQCVSVLDLAG